MSEPETQSTGVKFAESLRIGVVRGGGSDERSVSLKSGAAVVESLENRSCQVFEYDTDPDLVTQLKRDEIDVVFIALHGPGGEDGTLQALLEWHGIPYTGPGPQSSSICMDKLRSRQLMDYFDFPAPNWFVLNAGEEPRMKRDFERVVVKPRFQGSSLGLSIVDASSLGEAVTRAREFDDTVIIEEYVEGYEFTVGVVSTPDPSVLPAVGIKPSHEFFDYETKYQKGLTEYDVPADLPHGQKAEIEDLTRRIASALEVEALCRVDYILDSQYYPKVLEVNTIPGLTETSLLPMGAEESGISFDELIRGLIVNAKGERVWEHV